jgi:hypothetical protein
MNGCSSLAKKEWMLFCRHARRSGVGGDPLHVHGRVARARPTPRGPCARAGRHRTFRSPPLVACCVWRPRGAVGADDWLRLRRAAVGRAQRAEMARLVGLALLRRRVGDRAAVALGLGAASSQSDRHCADEDMFDSKKGEIPPRHVWEIESTDTCRAPNGASSPLYPTTRPVLSLDLLLHPTRRKAEIAQVVFYGQTHAHVIATSGFHQ